MTMLDTVLFSMLAGLITLKVALLASAAMLLAGGISARIRQRSVAPVTIAAKNPGLDRHA